jgi:hypothetical protein
MLVIEKTAAVFRFSAHILLRRGQRRAPFHSTLCQGKREEDRVDTGILVPSVEGLNRRRDWRMTFFKSPCRIGLALAILAAAYSAVQAADTQPPLLRYGFQAGQKYAYDVKVQGRIGDYEETLSGMLTWTVTSATPQQVVLKPTGAMTKAVKLHTSRPFPLRPPMFGGPSFQRTGGLQEVTIDRRGTVVFRGEPKFLPFLLGAQETLIFEELPAQAQPSWAKQREVNIVEKDQDARWVFRHGPLGGDTGKTYRTSKEETNYEVAETKGDTVSVTKRYALRSEEPEQPTKFNMTGEGQFVFNLPQGVVQSLSMKYEIQVTESNVSRKIPVTVSYQLLTAAELAQREKQAEEARLKVAEDAKPKPFEPGQRDKLLADLAAADAKTLQATAERLAKIVRDDRPDDFAKALAPLLSHSNNWVKGAAAKALAVWATPQVESELIEASKSENTWVRAAAIEGLGHVKTEAAAQAVGAQMNRNRGEAAKALKAMGPVAEAGAIECLKTSPNGWVNKEVSGVLAEIGREQGLAALQEFLPKAKAGFDRQDAEKAIDAIRRRLRASP